MICTATTTKAHVIEANYFSMIRRGYLGKSIKRFKTRISNEIHTLKGDMHD